MCSICLWCSLLRFVNPKFYINENDSGPPLKINYVTRTLTSIGKRRAFTKCSFFFAGVPPLVHCMFAHAIFPLSKVLRESFSRFKLCFSCFSHFNLSHSFVASQGSWPVLDTFPCFCYYSFRFLCKYTAQHGTGLQHCLKRWNKEYGLSHEKGSARCGKSKSKNMSTWR